MFRSWFVGMRVEIKASFEGFLSTLVFRADLVTGTLMYIQVRNPRNLKNFAYKVA